jgi:hypothetical protein
MTVSASGVACPLLILLALASPAVADGDLTWQAPASCPDEQALRRRVERRLERSLDDVKVGVDVDVEHRHGRYTARVDVDHRVRTVTSKKCGELADAVAVIVARVATDALAAREAKTTVATIEMPDDHVHVDELPEPERPATPRVWTIGARISGVSGIGVIPKVGLGGELAMTVRRHRMLGELAATRWLTSAAQFHNGAPAKVDVHLDTVAARWGWRPFEVPLRAWLAVETGSMSGTSLKTSEQLEHGRWLAAGAGFGIAWQIKPWVRLLGTMEGMVALERIAFTMGDGVVVYAPAPTSVRTTCGIEVGWQ